MPLFPKQKDLFPQEELLSMSVNAFIMLFSAVPLALFIGGLSYGMYSYGLYKMAGNTGITPAFLAWVPLLRLYTLGQLADRYNSTVEKQSVYRFLLPGLRILGGLLSTLWVFTTAVYATSLGARAGSFLIFVLVLLGLILILGSRILELLCYHKTFCDFEPENAVLYLILAVIGLEWIPLFFCRNNVPVGIAGHCRPRQPRYNVK